MAKSIFSCEVIDYLRKGTEVFYICYSDYSIYSLSQECVSRVQEILDYVDSQNDAKTYFYIMENQHEK